MTSGPWCSFPGIVPQGEKRLLGLGSLRAGMMSKETGKTYTVGAGFGLGFAQVDAAIASEDFREITAAAISVSLSF